MWPPNLLLADATVPNNVAQKPWLYPPTSYGIAGAARTEADLNIIQATHSRRRGPDFQSSHHRPQSSPRGAPRSSEGGAGEHKLARELVARSWRRRRSARLRATDLGVHLLSPGQARFPSTAPRVQW